MDKDDYMAWIISQMSDDELDQAQAYDDEMYLHFIAEQESVGELDELPF